MTTQHGTNVCLTVVSAPSAGEGSVVIGPGSVVTGPGSVVIGGGSVVIGGGEGVCLPCGDTRLCRYRQPEKETLKQ